MRLDHASQSRIQVSPFISPNIGFIFLLWHYLLNSLFDRGSTVPLLCAGLHRRGMGVYEIMHKNFNANESQRKSCIGE